MEIVVLCVYYNNNNKRRNKPQPPKYCEARGKYGGSYFAMDKVAKLGNEKVVLCPIQKDLK